MEESKTIPPPQAETKKPRGNFLLLALVLVIAAVSFFAGRPSMSSDDAPETQTVWHPTRYTYTYTTAEDVTIYSTVSEYDAQGKLLHSRSEDGNCIYESTYDENENLIEVLRYDAASGEFLHRETWGYDENGNHLNFTEYGAAGEILGRSEYTYDEKGRPTSSSYGADGAPCELTDTYEYTDAPDGGYTCVHRYFDSDFPSTETTVFDANGNMLRSETEHTGRAEYSIKYEYEYASFEVPIDSISKEDTK